MAKKAYLIGIGGTGARVLRSCLHLWAGGASGLNGWELVPMLLDRDQSNGDLQRTTQLLANYTQVQKTVQRGDREDQGFFYPRIKTFAQAVTDTTDSNENGESAAAPAPAQGGDFVFDWGLDAQMNNLEDVIDVHNLPQGTRMLMEMLYDNGEAEDERNHLRMPLDVGFKGAPHVGAVALHQLSEAEQLEKLASNLEQDDRIFIISSTFGGTGASGAPLLAKILREDPDLSAPDTRKKIPIGFLAMLPYYQVPAQKGGMIHSSSFMTKTKTALRYYAEQQDVNALYYIAEPDMDDKEYTYSEGHQDQKNPAQFAEMAGAFCFLNFLQADQLPSYQDGKEPQGFAYALKEGTEEGGKTFNLKHIGDISRDKVALPLAQYYLLANFLLLDEANFFRKLTTNPWIKENDLQDLEARLKGDKNAGDFEALAEILRDFRSYVDEIQSTSDKSYKLFETTSSERKAPRKLIAGHEPTNGSKFDKNSLRDLDDLNQFLIEARGATHVDDSKLLKLLKVFHAGTKKALPHLKTDNS